MSPLLWSEVVRTWATPAAMHAGIGQCCVQSLLQAEPIAEKSPQITLNRSLTHVILVRVACVWLLYTYIHR